VSRPTAENLDVMFDKPSTGEGMEVFAPAWFAVRLSLLPNNTVHVGPPDCIYIYIYIYMMIISPTFLLFSLRIYIIYTETYQRNRSFSSKG
jgi:hypothetical protein